MGCTRCLKNIVLLAVVISSLLGAGLIWAGTMSMFNIPHSNYEMDVENNEKNGSMGAQPPNADIFVGCKGLIEATTLDKTTHPSFSDEFIEKIKPWEIAKCYAVKAPFIYTGIVAGIMIVLAAIGALVGGLRGTKGALYFTAVFLGVAVSAVLALINEFVVVAATLSEYADCRNIHEEDMPFFTGILGKNCVVNNPIEDVHNVKTAEMALKSIGVLFGGAGVSLFACLVMTSLSAWQFHRSKGKLAQTVSP